MREVIAVWMLVSVVMTYLSVVGEFGYAPRRGFVFWAGWYLMSLTWPIWPLVWLRNL